MATERGPEGWLASGHVGEWNAWRAQRPDVVPDLASAQLPGSVLIGADLRGADLRGADLTAADLREADLSAARLDAAALGDAQLVGADLRRAGADHATMAGADLRLADLRDARLLRSDLRGANATGSRCEGLRLDGSDLQGATGFSNPRRTRRPTRMLVPVVSAVLVVVVLTAGALMFLTAGGGGVGNPGDGPMPIEVDDLLRASVAVENTDDLRVDTPTRVEVRVVLLPDSADGDPSPPPAPTTPPPSDGTSVPTTVPATGRASVSLLAASTASFELTALQDENPRQLVRSEPAVWLFDVRPLVAGEQELIVRFTPYTCPPPCADGSGAEPVAPTLVRESVVVSRPPSGGSWAGGWVVWAMIGFTALAVIAAATALASRRRRPVAPVLRPVSANLSGLVFVSYRRRDSAGWAGRIADRLGLVFGREHVFLDVENLPEGADIRAVIEAALERSAVVVVLIGPEWIDGSATSNLTDTHDYVRLELETALERGVHLVPVLVDGASMPAAASLPGALHTLERINAVRIDAARFDNDLERLAVAILDGGEQTPPRDPAPSAP